MEIISRRDVPGLASLFLARLRGDPRNLIEFVDTIEPGVPKNEKWVMMISTQIGCPVGCEFCDAGSLDFHGNLSAEEMMDQIRRIAEANPELALARHPKIEVHFSRMGEPSLNPAVLEALRWAPRGFQAPGLLPNLSTVAPKSPVTEVFFEELLRIKDEHYSGGRFQLQFSVHSTSETARREIAPVKKWSLEEIAAYGVRFFRPGDRKITLNFALSKESEFDPAIVARVFPRDCFLIKITPVNPTKTSDRNGRTNAWRSPPATAEDFVFALETAGFEVIVSPGLPEEISAAASCGQLWSEILSERAGILLRNRDREDRSYVTVEDLHEKFEAWMQRLGARRGGAPFHPEKAGLLVVDMQEQFLDPRGRSYLPPARAILSNVRRVAEAFRGAGRPVFFTVHLPAGSPEKASPREEICPEGTLEARVSPTLRAEPRRIFQKTGYSAFDNPELEPALRFLGVEQIVLTGAPTDLCVASTARAAFDRGFSTFIVPDATAAETEEAHWAALDSLSGGFSGLLSSAELRAALKPFEILRREAECAGS